MSVEALLEGAGQGHLARALARLPGAEREALRDQIEALDLDLIARLVAGLSGDAVVAPEAIEPPSPESLIALPRDAADEERDRRARAAGESHLRDGRVAAVLLAGGQGTRLGFEGPKGLYPFAPLSGRTLFSHHAATIAALRSRYATPLPWYILTSPINDGPTREAFAANDHFGLAPDSVRTVVQGTLPAVDRSTGRILLSGPGTLALSPDGHGGLLSALASSGALEEMEREGVRTIFTFQVDNPLARICRPEVLGHHLLAGAEMASVVVRKLSAAEKMGVIARVGGRTGVVEYSDLPAELAEQTDDRGELVYWAGSIAVHCIEVDFARRMTAGGLRLPYHHAFKKVPYVDEDGLLVEPREPNAVKFETFLFDALPSASRTVTVEAAREDEFSPIKNAHGADSPETARRALNRLYARWLESIGIEVPREGDGEPPDIEIDPRVALDPSELSAALPPGFRVDGPVAISPPEASS